MSIHAFQNVFLVITELQPQSNQKMFCIDIEKSGSYQPFCDDFGPMNLASIHQFCDGMS